MRNSPGFWLLISLASLPLACTNSASNNPSAPTTVINIVNSPPPVPTWNPSIGKNWYQATASAAVTSRYYHTNLIFNNLMWIIAGYASGPATYKSDVWSSSDGVNWTAATAAATFAARGTHSSVVFNPATGSGLDGKMCVIGGTNGATCYNDVWSSPDGVIWSAATTQAP